jgi:hypothetical protein
MTGKEDITSAMIEAGADILAGFDLTLADESIWAVRVFEAMNGAASISRRSESCSEPALE